MLLVAQQPVCLLRLCLQSSWGGCHELSVTEPERMCHKIDASFNGHCGHTCPECEDRAHSEEPACMHGRY
jgi:hypothetical protein